MNEGIHLDLDTWIVPGQIRTYAMNEYTYITLYITITVHGKVFYHYFQCAHPGPRHLDSPRPGPHGPASTGAIGDANQER